MKTRARPRILNIRRVKLKRSSMKKMVNMTMTVTHIETEEVRATLIAPEMEKEDPISEQSP